MNIVVIDNYDSFVFNLVRYLQEAISAEITVFRNNEIDFEALEECDGILLSPGPGIPNEAGDMNAVLQQFARTKPILGVCLGHQAIGEFFGAILVQNEHPIHGKSSRVKTLTGRLFKGLPEDIEVGRYHSWTLASPLPECLKVTALTMSGEIMAFEHESLNITGVQFHPESILTPDGRTMLNNWINTLKS